MGGQDTIRGGQDTMRALQEEHRHGELDDLYLQSLVGPSTGVDRTPSGVDRTL